MNNSLTYGKATTAKRKHSHRFYYFKKLDLNEKKRWSMKATHISQEVNLRIYSNPW